MQRKIHKSFTVCILHCTRYSILHIKNVSEKGMRCTFLFNLGALLDGMKALVHAWTWMVGDQFLTV